VHQFGGMSDTSWEFAFQFFTGLSYDLGPNVTANIGYRYLNMGGGITVDGNSTGHYIGQSVEGGLTIKF
jgi:opacity protein-like surface antigen